MLVLARKTGESLLIKVPGVEDIEVCILEGTGRSKRVRIGIEADPSIRILRKELEGRDTQTGRPPLAEQCRNARLHQGGESATA